MSNNINTPRLRFPEFTGEWDYVYGNELFEPISNKNHNSDLPILALTQEQGAVPRDMINYNVVVSDKSVAGYKVVEVDDFIISLRSFQGGIEYSRYKGLCSPAYIVLRKKSKDLSSDFYRIYFKSFNYIQALNKNLEGIRDGKMISYQQFSEIKLPKPSPAEQEKIAACLTEMDNLISAQAQKVDALKEKKKGLMQQLFPQPGQTTPQLRFPGFTGDWDFVDGDDLFEPISNKNHNSDLPVLALTQDQGAVPRDIINYNVIVSDKSVAGYKVVEVDDFIISLRSFQGGIEYSRYKGLCSPAYIVLRKKSDKLCSDFYRIYFKSFNYIQALNKNLEGIRDGKMISYKQFSEIKLPKPSPSEQQKIAECLSALDEQIAAESAKVDALKDHKKGLMQQMFPIGK